LELNYRITARLFWALFCGLTFLAFCSDPFQNETGFVKGLDSQAVRRFSFHTTENKAGDPFKMAEEEYGSGLGKRVAELLLVERFLGLT
jgi:hypothetical protein